MTQHFHQPGDRVTVTVADKVLPGFIAQLQDPGPIKPWLTVKIQFDDPLVMGGTGSQWFSPDAVDLE